MSSISVHNKMFKCLPCWFPAPMSTSPWHELFASREAPRCALDGRGYIVHYRIIVDNVLVFLQCTRSYSGADSVSYVDLEQKCKHNKVWPRDYCHSVMVYLLFNFLVRIFAKVTFNCIWNENCIKMFSWGRDIKCGSRLCGVYLTGTVYNHHWLW